MLGPSGVGAGHDHSTGTQIKHTYRCIAAGQVEVLPFAKKDNQCIPEDMSKST